MIIRQSITRENDREARARFKNKTTMCISSLLGMCSPNEDVVFVKLKAETGN